MKKNYLLFFLLLILNNSYSQCPSGQFGITNPSFEGPVGAHITPSPWNTCGITPDTQPGYWGINLAPSDGSSYVGLVNGGPGWLEGVSQTLSNSLLAGFTYNLTIDLAMGNSNQGGIQPAPTRIKIYGGNAVCQKTQLLWTSPTISHVTWQKYNIILAPNQNFSAIYIVIDDTSPLNSYMLIDNIRQLSTSVASVVSNITCNGGTGGINLTTSGGMPPYIFHWNDGVTTEDRTGLAAGAYTVTVTDANGCISTKSFTITEPTALNSVPTQVNVLCNGNATGSATAVISGGVAPYTYVWNNGITSTTNQATNLEAGTYEVTVTDASGCIIKQNFTITQPDILNVNLQETSFNICSACNDSNLVATITGGTAPYTYSWNDGVITKDRSDLLNGTYTLTVTDAEGCTVSKNIVVSTKVELPYRDFTYTNGNAVSELNNFTTCQSGAVVKASSGRYTNGIWYDGSYELFVNNTSLGVFTGEKIIDISSYTPITSVRAVGNHNFWSWTAIEVKTYSDVVDVPPTSPIVSTIYYELNNTAVPLTATLNGVGTTLKWYTDELGSDYSATAPMPLTNQLGTTSYYVSQANSIGCESARSKIDVIVVSPISYTHQINNLLCFTSTGSIDLSVSGGTGSYTYLWSNGATTEDITVSQGGNYTCTITDQNSGFSITTQILQVLQPLPLQATIVTIDVACFGENNGEAIVTATDGTAPYTYVWNNGITSTTNEATNLVAGTYEVTVTDANGCIITESFTITESSALNSVPSQVNVLCHGNATGSATAAISGGVSPYTYVWNNGITSTTNEATNLSAGTYEVTVTDANGCIITELFTITEPPLVLAPLSHNQEFCIGDSKTVNDLVAVGSNLKWYLSQYAQIPIQPSTLLTNGTYYGTQTVNGCESKSRIEIKVTVYDTPAPTAIAVQYFCANTTALIGDLLVMGTDILWYNAPTGGSPLNPLASLSNNTVYYASQRLNGCESVTRTVVSVVIHAVNPITSSAIAVCSGTTIGNITIDNYNAGQLKWYDAAIGGNELSSATMVSNGTYYVSTFTNNACISDRQPLQVVVLSQVAVPTVGTQVFCGTAEVKDLPAQTIYGSILKWYSSSAATVPLTANTPLGNGTYYVEHTIGQCSSLRTPVAVRVVSLTAPILNNAVLCHGATVDDIPANQNPSVKYLWFADSTTTVPLNGSDLLATGHYFAAFTQNGCVSNRTSVYITVNPKPAKPTGSMVQTFSDYAVVADLKMNEKSVVWFDNYSDALNGINILSQNTVLQDGKDYYAVHVGPNACLSDPISVKVAIVLGTRGFDLTSLEYYPNPVEHELTIKNADAIKVITVYDILGKQIMQKAYNKSELKIDFSSYSAETYMVRIETVKGSQFVKIIKK